MHESICRVGNAMDIWVHVSVCVCVHSPALLCLTVLEMEALGKATEEDAVIINSGVGKGELFLIAAHEGYELVFMLE